MPMSESAKKKLIEAGRGGLVEIMEINESGYAGCMPNGNIVDRRKFPEAIPVQKNSLFNIPEAKPLPRCCTCGSEMSLKDDGIGMNMGTPHEVFQCDDCHLNEHGVRITGACLYFHNLFSK